MTAELVEHLEELLRENYKARARGELPDEWFWADLALMNEGYCYSENFDKEAVS